LEHGGLHRWPHNFEMRKDTVYSLRMTEKIRDALRRAAGQEQRTIASLLNKIVSDYLETRGYLAADTPRHERRRYPRQKTALPAIAHHKIGSDALVGISCVIMDLSLGGALIAYPRGSEIKDTSISEIPNFNLCFQLPRSQSEVCIQCDACRVFDIDNGLKIGAAFLELGGQDLKMLDSYLA